MRIVLDHSFSHRKKHMKIKLSKCFHVNEQTLFGSQTHTPSLKNEQISYLICNLSWLVNVPIIKSLSSSMTQKVCKTEYFSLLFCFLMRTDIIIHVNMCHINVLTLKIKQITQTESTGQKSKGHYHDYSAPNIIRPE